MNLRPLDPQSSALPNCATTRCAFKPLLKQLDYNNLTPEALQEVIFHFWPQRCQRAREATHTAPPPPSSTASRRNLTRPGRFAEKITVLVPSPAQTALRKFRELGKRSRTVPGEGAVRPENYKNRRFHHISAYLATCQRISALFPYARPLLPPAAEASSFSQFIALGYGAG